MRFSLIASVVCLGGGVANANLLSFSSTAGAVDSQMFSLSGSIDAIKSVADSLGHTQISNKCLEARNHVSSARAGWNGILNFVTSPWNARSSAHATTVKRRMSSCGSSLTWIYNQPEITHPAYAPHISNCKALYTRCLSGCNSVWNWPTPPVPNAPTPSGGYSGGYARRQKRDESSCPSSEVACPISFLSENLECLDTQTELSSCGGCVTLDAGENCLKIPGAQGVGCLSGSCVVFSVEAGWKLNEEGRPELL